MGSPDPQHRVRSATAADAAAIRDLYRDGDAAGFASRLADVGAADGTSYFVAETQGEIVAVFALTSLGRLKPGARRRVMLHEIQLRARVRGTSVVEDVFSWLQSDLGAGGEVELLALTPLEQQPSVFTRFGLSESHRIFKWAAAGWGEGA